jgi:hypothetical protein
VNFVRTLKVILTADTIHLELQETAPELSFHVCAVSGDDHQATGTHESPFQTVHRALVASRAADVPVGTPKNIVLAKGMHYLNATLSWV